MKTKHGFGDVRTPGELLSSGRPPKSVSYVFKNPATEKIRSILSSGTSAISGFSPIISGVSSSVFKGAAKAALALTGMKWLSAFSGKAGTKVSNFSRVSSSALGARIIEETNPIKLVRPLREGASINPALVGAQLAQTAAAHSMRSLVANVPIASGVSTPTKIFKTLRSLRTHPRYFNRGQEVHDSPIPGVNYLPVGGPESVLIAQRGLLPDEIMYRLTLLAENVYAPMSALAQSRGYAPLVILEGFRAENSGSSPHERGEALDITMGDGGLGQAGQLFELAQWSRDNLIYDQLILCFSPMNGGQVWIHVTLTPDINRRVVYTRAFDDTFRDGLYLFGPYSDASQQASDWAASAHQSALAQQVASVVSSRSSKLNPISVNTSEQRSTFVFRSEFDTGIPGHAPGTGEWPGSGAEEVPGGYMPDNTSQNIIMAIAAQMLSEPQWRPPLPHNTNFLREMLRRAYTQGVPSSGVGAVGLNAKRGSSDLSLDAIAILNPTGCMGFKSWSPGARVQIMDVLIDYGGPSSTAYWGDVTLGSWGVGGGFVTLDGQSMKSSPGDGESTPSATGIPSPEEVQAATEQAMKTQNSPGV